MTGFVSEILNYLVMYYYFFAVYCYFMKFINLNYLSYVI